MLLLTTSVVEKAWSAGASAGNAFRLAVSKSDGSVLCAVNEANQTTKLSTSRLRLTTYHHKSYPSVIRRFRSPWNFAAKLTQP